MKQYRLAYAAQKSGARHRGIEFRLSFEEWLAFWGDDISRRGRGPANLQMQRMGDKGAYEIGNIKKGVPRENSKTAGACKRNLNGFRNAAEHQATLDRMMLEESSAATGEDEEGEDDGFPRLGYASSYDRRYMYAADKGR
jgi:hypothetical protein